MMSIADNIRSMRISNNMEQKELAKLLEVSNKTVSSWECGRTEPKIGMIEKMAAIFGCSKTDLLDDSIWIETQNPDFDLVIFNNDSDAKLIDAFHNAPDGIKESIKKLLDIKEDES